MSLASELESLVSAFRSKVGTLTEEAETHIGAVLGIVKDQEALAEAKVAEEIAHLQSLGYTVVAPNALPQAA